MKLKIPNDLLVVDLSVLCLILTITFFPSNFVRIMLGLPFLLFFPGYTVIATLFVRRIGMDAIERTALSLGVSVAISALIGLALNYTPWGIRLMPALLSISAFVIIMSGAAWFRRRRLGINRLTIEMHLKFPKWEGYRPKKALMVVIGLLILGEVGTLAYTIARPMTREAYTEFYVLGMNGKAVDYPSDFVVIGTTGSVKAVRYGTNALPIGEKYGRVNVGIIDHEQKTATYSVLLQIDGQPSSIIYEGMSVSRLDGVQLGQGEKWEQQIGFAPQHVGDNQKVEFFLYRDGSTDPENSLHIWINVKSG